MIALLPHLFGGGNMVTMTYYEKGTPKQLDRDWVILMKKAKEMGISKREIRNFLDQNRPGY
ncbi:anti-repressor SinI family protein [Aquisalibacillus elongatus]|nr:anti-repressor SinI family protein [Aquisalibacillus elongatus]